MTIFEVVFSLTGLVLTSLYYLAASLVFPEDLKVEPDLDQYFWRNRRTVPRNPRIPSDLVPRRLTSSFIRSGRI